MDLASGEHVIYEGRPSWRSILGFHTAGLVVAVVAGVIGKVASGWGVAAAAFVAVLALTVLAGFLRRVGTHYTITERRLYIRRGLLSRSEQHTTLDRVQNVATQQSFFERILQIGTVEFDTAGTEDADFAFRGVANPQDVVAAVDRAQQAAGVAPV